MTVTVSDLVDGLQNGTLDRGTFYLKVYELTGSSAALFMGQVSQFSGLLGGAAIGANYLLTDGAKNATLDSNGNLVNSGLYDTHYSDTDGSSNDIYLMSQQVAINFGIAVRDEIDLGHDGDLNVLDGNRSAQLTWANFNGNSPSYDSLGQFFPGYPLAGSGCAF